MQRFSEMNADGLESDFGIKSCCGIIVGGHVEGNLLYADVLETIEGTENDGSTETAFAERRQYGNVLDCSTLGGKLHSLDGGNVFADNQRRSVRNQ